MGVAGGAYWGIWCEEGAEIDFGVVRIDSEKCP
nr:hypothetical protein CPGR_01093 [Mycolicibacter nonchromogenicus]